MSLEFACYFPGENPLFMAIELSSGGYVQKLLDAIAAKLHSRHHLPLDPEETRQPRALEWLHRLPPNCHLDEALGDPYDAYNRKVKKALNKGLDSFSSLPSPSEAIQHPEDVFGRKAFVSTLAGWRSPCRNFQPRAGRLGAHLGNLDQVEVSEFQVSQAAATFIALAPSIKPVHVWRLDDFIMGALELKNILGIGGDALSQAIVDYVKIISRKKCEAFREYCNFPSVLIGITANRLEIAIAVCVGSIYVTKLLTLDLSLDFHASDNIICLARVFKVLKCHLLGLKEYYRSIKTTPAPSSKLSCLFPSPTLIDPSTPMPKLAYHEFLARDAHRLLAEAQLAPKLHFCGRVIGDLYMVVMEYVEGKSVWQLRNEDTPIPQVVATKVGEAVHRLHEHDIVFGDLRDNNILVVGSGADARAILVDFDWAGEHGKGRYPATLNRGIVGDTWHRGVLPYHIMHKDHDLSLLEKLKARCV
ncbi:hypothetical protein BJ912DRAFT_993599 [Pholiota molesta]|nr:hypothetical protein BJ912DRAFT_993599 [Pholiota molesta]